MISVILCTHNPKPDIFAQCLEALQAQDLGVDAWELLIIDNASAPPVTEQIDLSWHPQGRIVTEPTLGLSPARLCGFSNAEGEYFVLVDDDNILAPDYLTQALQIIQQNPKLGAFGGSISGDFECEVPDWMQDNLIYLAVREIRHESIANAPGNNFQTPAGAGMLVQRSVAQYYQDLLKKDKRRAQLDRQGDSLVSSGDTDLALCAWDMGLEIGNFPQLKLQHIIPASRLRIEYMQRLHEAMAYSESMLAYLRTNLQLKPPSLWRMFKTWLRMHLREAKENRLLYAAHLRGLKKAAKQIRKFRGSA